MWLYISIILALHSITIADQFDSTEQQSIVNEHNEVRRTVAKGNMVGYPNGDESEYKLPIATNMIELRWDDALAKISSDYANNCQYQHSDSNAREAALDTAVNTDGLGNFEYSAGNAIGENIAYMYPSGTSSSMIELWLNDEAPKYRYGSIYGNEWGYTSANDFCQYSQTGSSDDYCGHFTQGIWANTEYVGCGYADCPSIGTFMVCNYYSAGNYLSQSIYSSGTTTCTDCPNGYTTCNDGLCSAGGSGTTQPTSSTSAPPPEPSTTPAPPPIYEAGDCPPTQCSWYGQMGTYELLSGLTGLPLDSATEAAVDDVIIDEAIDYFSTVDGLHSWNIVPAVTSIQYFGSTYLYIPMTILFYFDDGSTWDAILAAETTFDPSAAILDVINAPSSAHANVRSEIITPLKKVDDTSISSGSMLTATSDGKTNLMIILLFIILSMMCCMVVAMFWYMWNRKRNKSNGNQLEMGYLQNNNVEYGNNVIQPTLTINTNAETIATKLPTETPQTPLIED